MDIDLVWSNLALHWHATPHDVLQEWSRILKLNGLVFFSCFGPATLQEVRAAAHQAPAHQAGTHTSSSCPYRHPATSYQ